MKAILPFLLPLACSAQLSLSSGSFSSLSTVPTVVPCLSSDTAIPHNLLLYGWQPEDTGTWASEAGDAAFTFTQAADSSGLTSGKPTGACNLAMHCVFAGGSTVQSGYRWDHGSELDTNSIYDVVAHIYVVSTSLASGASIGLFGFSAVTNAAFGTGVDLNNSSGVYKVFAQGSTASTGVAISLGSWHKIHLHIVPEANSCWLTVDDGDQKTFQRNGTGLRYFHLGFVASVGTGDATDYWIDLVCINQ